MTTYAIAYGRKEGFSCMGLVEDGHSGTLHFSNFEAAAMERARFADKFPDWAYVIVRWDGKDGYGPMGEQIPGGKQHAGAQRLQPTSVASEEPHGDAPAQPPAPAAAAPAWGSDLDLTMRDMKMLLDTLVHLQQEQQHVLTLLGSAMDRVERAERAQMSQGAQGSAP